MIVLAHDTHPVCTYILYLCCCINIHAIESLVNTVFFFVVHCPVIVQGLNGSEALDTDTVLWNEKKQPIGKVVL